MTLAGWPQSELSMISIKVVVGEATFIDIITFALISSVEVRGETDTVMTFTTPVLKAGTASLKFVDIESGVSLAVQNLQVFAYPQGGARACCESYVWIGEETTPVGLLGTLFNCPQSEEAIEIRFGNSVLQPYSVF